MEQLQVLSTQKILEKEFTIYGDAENPLFLAKDVAEWIEHNNTSMMLKSISKEEKVLHTIYISGQRRQVWFLTEEGLYEVIMLSRKPLAKQFKSDVKIILKTKRKAGGYVASPELMVSTYFPNTSGNEKLLIKSLCEQILTQQQTTK